MFPKTLTNTITRFSFFLNYRLQLQNNIHVRHIGHKSKLSSTGKSRIKSAFKAMDEASDSLTRAT